MKFNFLFLLIFALVFIGFVFGADSLDSFNGNFTEGFESGSFLTNDWSSSGGSRNDWIISTDNPRTGTYHAYAKDTKAESTLITNLSTVGYGNIVFSFWYVTNIKNNQYLRADWYNGTRWINVLDITSTDVGTYTLANFSLPSSAENNSDFAIRFRCYNDGGGEHCDVDDIQVTGEDALGINLIDLYLISQEGTRIDYNNNTAVEEADVMVFNFSVNHIDSIDTWYLNYSANGTNGCALGNKQSSYCYSYPEWIQFINGSETETFNAFKKSDFDYINSYLLQGVLSNFSFVIDEHYNPNIFKWYEVDYNFSDEKWLNDTQYRIGTDTMIKIEVNSSIIPVEMDFARVDLRVGYSGAPEKLEMHACNSSLVNQDPHFYEGCNLIGEMAYYELYENGTKFKAFFTKSLIDQIGDFKYVVLHSEGENPGEYYYISSYGFNNENYSNHWEYSNDLGENWNRSSLMYDTQMNVNWFYAGVNSTALVYRFFVNTTSGYEEYLEGNWTWDVSPTNNYAPLAVISNPDPLNYISTPYNVTFSISDTNDDDLNVTLFLYKGGSLNKTLFNEINGALKSYYWNESVLDSEYDLVLEVCEVNTTDLYCRNNTRSITIDNTAPFFNSFYPVAASNFSNIRSLNVSVNITEENIDFVYVNVTYPNSSVVRFNMLNNSLANYSSEIGITEVGNYSLLFFSEDLAGNTETQSSNFSIYDTNSPSIKILYPLGQNFSHRDSVDFVLNFSDFSRVGEIYANISYPNTTVRKVSGFSECLESDDFNNNNTIGIYWNKASEGLFSGQTCFTDINESLAGHMHILINGSGNEEMLYCGFNSQEKVYGDFDLNIEFNATVLEEDSLFVFRSSNLETFVPEGTRVYLLLSRSGGNLVYRIGYSLNGVINETTISVNETYGRFRIKKSNSTGLPIFNLFYFNNSNSSWINPLGDIYLNRSRETQKIQIYAVTSSPNYGKAEIFLDSFAISEHTNYIFNSGNYFTDGLYDVSFFVNDTEGNINDTETTNFTIAVLNHAPSRPFIFEPDVGNYYSGEIEIDWQEVNDEENDTLQYNVSLLNSNESFNSTIVSNYGNSTITQYMWNSSLVIDGEYGLEVVVFENDTPESYSSTDNMDGTFFVDNTKPSVELISSSYSGGRIYFTMNSSDANFDNVTVFLHSISGLIKTYSNNSSSFSNSFSVGSGTYYLNATSYDLAGNFENTETVNYFISESSSSSSSSGGSSGSYYYLENLPKEGRNFRLYSGQKVRFVVKNETHFLEVISLKNNSAKIVVYSDFFEKNMAIGNSWKIDIDDDLIYDFKVNLNSIWKGIYANITVLPFIENIFLEEDLKKIMGGLNKTSLASSNDLKFFINLDDSVNFPFPLNLTFEIFDMNKQILYGGEEIISKASKKNYMFPDLNLQSGEYIFFANLSYKNYVLKTFEENFIVGPIKSLITGEVVGGEREYFSWILWGIGFFVFFVFVFMFFRKRRKMKKHKRKRKSLEQIKSLNFDQFIRELNKI